jgi:hypothetical protein
LPSLLDCENLIELSMVWELAHIYECEGRGRTLMYPGGSLLRASIYIYAALRTCGVLDDETINLKEYTQKNSQRASIPI